MSTHARFYPPHPQTPFKHLHPSAIVVNFFESTKRRHCGFLSNLGRTIFTRGCSLAFPFFHCYESSKQTMCSTLPIPPSLILIWKKKYMSFLIVNLVQTFYFSPSWSIDPALRIVGILPYIKCAQVSATAIVLNINFSIYWHVNMLGYVYHRNVAAFKGK